MIRWKWRDKGYKGQAEQRSEQNARTDRGDGSRGAHSAVSVRHHGPQSWTPVRMQGTRGRECNPLEWRTREDQGKRNNRFKGRMYTQRAMFLSWKERTSTKGHKHSCSDGTRQGCREPASTILRQGAEAARGASGTSARADEESFEPVDDVVHPGEREVLIRLGGGGGLLIRAG